VKHKQPEKRNITLSLPSSLLKRIKRLALDRTTSVSALLRALMEDALRSSDDYERSRKRALEDLKHPRDLGTYGKATWTRDKLHERR
jgi:hypothetical protein